jgi:uncharacterized protein
MTNMHGDFIWYELMTTDADAAAAFYAGVLPWTVGDQHDYREIKVGDEHIGGILPLAGEMTMQGARPAWVGYVQVEDVDKMIDSIEQAGGRILMPARELPEAGRFAMVADPQGAAFYLMKPKPTSGNHDVSSNAFSYDRPRDGHCAWNELATSDPAAALHFYGQRFGWVKDGEMDMGPMGKYEFLRHAGRSDGSVMGQGMLGAVMPTMPQMPLSAWRYYFRVPDIDAAVTAVGNGGGQIVNGPQEIPGGDFSLNGIDLQGAHFALVGKRKG